MIGGFLSRTVHEFALAGVNFSIPGNGGTVVCRFPPRWQLIAESVVFVPLSLLAIVFSLPHLEYPKKEELAKENGHALDPEVREQLIRSLPPADREHPPVVLPHRRYVFNFYAAVFFVEFFYKLVTRLLFGEAFIYFVQHGLIVVVPLYLMSLEGAFVPESTRNVAWPVFSLGLIVLYHFFFLQSTALLTSVNLNCILCPAVSDPFSGRFYRLCAVAHQCLVVPLVTKFYAWSSSTTFRW
ncbi:hypothetical protein M3Y99_01478900 [Aphelenchoides fujianensis]|nr:hypothetical protein M3Y99_01478900 [Aphelenchoides fujianensis]